MKKPNPLSMVPNLRRYAWALISLAFPNLCMVCARHLLKREKEICKPCADRLPYTYFHKLPANAVERVFWGRVEVVHATSLLFFRKGEQAQQILHAIKYKGNHALGEEMGRLLGEALWQSEWLKEIDLIVPVPLHPKKLRMRGFNQSETIARGLSECVNIPYSCDVLRRALFTSTQTRKSRYERYQNMEGVFAVADAQLLEGKHVLLIDDVLTTGSTLEACAQKVLEVNGTKVSMATLAFASM